MHHILIVEDDTALRDGLVSALRSDTVATDGAADLKEARRLFFVRQYDLLLMDYNLPDGCGIDLCRELLSVRELPVIFLTVRDAEMDEIAAFRAGACDYVRKPFSLTVLTERINAALRRRTNVHIYEDIRYHFDFAALVFSRDGTQVTLSATEQKLLSVFCRHKGQILERQTLIAKIWACDSDYIDENALSVTVKRLRDKLGADCIGTVYGLGYIWKGGRA